MAILLKLGFIYAGPNGSGLHCFELASNPFLTDTEPREITLAANPGSRNWRQKHRHRLARHLGLNSWQLERVIAGQPVESVRREQGPGRKANETVVMEHAMSLGIGCTREHATRLIGRFGSTKAARRALDGMAKAAVTQARLEHRAVA